MVDHLHAGSPFGRWQRHTAMALWTGLAVIALVLVWRRAAGAFSAELTGLPACAFSTLAAIAGVVAWMLFSARERPPRRATERLGPVLLTLLPPLLVGIALFPRGSSSTAAYLTVLLLLAAASLAVLEQWLPAVPRVTGTAHDESEPSSAALASGAARLPVEPPPHAATMTPGPGPSTGALSDPQSNGSPAAHSRGVHGTVAHWSRRETLAGGTEQIEGGSRLAFAPGQKQAVVHLAFTPPLCGVPAIECEPLDTADVELTVAAAYAYGARIEARRSGPLDAPLNVEIGYAVSLQPGAATGALPTST